jgi:hypothetical protein
MMTNNDKKKHIPYDRNSLSKKNYLNNYNILKEKQKDQNLSIENYAYVALLHRFNFFDFSFNFVVVFWKPSPSFIDFVHVAYG